MTLRLTRARLVQRRPAARGPVASVRHRRVTPRATLPWLSSKHPSVCLRPWASGTTVAACNKELHCRIAIAVVPSSDGSRGSATARACKRTCTTGPNRGARRQRGSLAALRHSPAPSGLHRHGTRNLAAFAGPRPSLGHPVRIPAAPGVCRRFPPPGAALDVHPPAGGRERGAARLRLANAMRQWLPAAGGLLGLARQWRLPHLASDSAAAAPRVFADARSGARHARAYSDADGRRPLPVPAPHLTRHGAGNTQRPRSRAVPGAPLARGAPQYVLTPAPRSERGGGSCGGRATGALRRALSARSTRPALPLEHRVRPDGHPERFPNLRRRSALLCG